MWQQNVNVCPENSNLWLKTLISGAQNGYKTLIWGCKILDCAIKILVCGHKM